MLKFSSSRQVKVNPKTDFYYVTGYQPLSIQKCNIYESIKLNRITKSVIDIHLYDEFEDRSYIVSGELNLKDPYTKEILYKREITWKEAMHFDFKTKEIII